MIDKRGGWWKGDSFEDLRTYLIEYTAASGYPAGPIARSICACGHAVFDLAFDDDEGCARRRCLACGTERLIADSDDYWEDADAVGAQCPCGNEAFELGIAFSLREDGDVRWITVAGRCIACGVLGTYVEWKIDYSPTDHLLLAT